VTRYLDTELLAEFEAVLGELRVPITRVWRPGLDDASIDALLEPLGIQLPEEARRWWRWRNGVVPGTRGPDWDLTPRRPC
jgi:hypothetical protein